MKRPFVLVAAAALLNRQDKVLLARRPEGKPMAGLWEFPGGKVEEGETLEIALVRELEEELGILVRVDDLMPFSFASHSYESFDLLMPLFLCRDWRGRPENRVHSEIAWVETDRLRAFDMPPADDPLVRALERAFPVTCDPR